MSLRFYLTRIDEKQHIEYPNTQKLEAQDKSINYVFTKLMKYFRFYQNNEYMS